MRDCATHLLPFASQEEVADMSDRSFTQYKVIAEAFTVLDIARPVIVVPPETRMNYGLPTGPAGYPHDWCWLVADEQRVYGYLTEEIIAEADPAECVMELVEPLGARSVVPSSMSLLDLIRRLAEQEDWTLFVLTDEGITHVVTGEEYDSMPVKLSIFALLLELEAEMNHMLRSQPERLNERLGYLSPQRREQLTRRCARPRIPFHHWEHANDPLTVIDWANFFDKERMLYSDPMTRGLFQFGSSDEADRFFDLVRRVRNAVAHGRPLTDADEDLVVPEEFATFIHDVRRTILLFAEERRAGQRHGDSAQN